MVVGFFYGEKKKKIKLEHTAIGKRENDAL